MRTIKLSNGIEVEVSDEIYQIAKLPNLYRKINGIDGRKELGWHYDPEYSYFIPLHLAYDGIDANDAYKGFRNDLVRAYHTHPLNHRR